MGFFMDCSGQSDLGRRLLSNEDQFLISDICRSMRIHQTSLALDQQTRLFGETKSKVLLVADGMGESEAGERASQLVTDGVVDYVLNRLNWFVIGSDETDEDFESDLKRALVSCQKRIDAEADAIPQRKGMRSTLTLGYIAWPKLFLVHAGDSRCYLLRNGQLQCLTRDHNFPSRPTTDPVQIQQSNNNAKRDITLDNDSAKVLWNAIGGEAGNAPHPDATALELQLHDVLLFCTDGLTDMLDPTEIKKILTQDISAEQICFQLVNAANNAGGKDNITVVVSRFTDIDPTPLQAEYAEEPIQKSLAVDATDEIQYAPADQNSSSTAKSSLLC